MFVGSQYGDSQVIRLSGSRLPDGNFVEVIDRFKSLGPIVDFALVDIEKIGHSSVVACSGAYKEGSLRVIRKGSNLTIKSYVQPVDWPIVNLFSLERRGRLCVTDPFRTHVIKVDDDGGMDEVSAFGNFDLTQPSLLIYEYEDLAIQVTPRQITLTCGPSGRTIPAQQSPPETFTQAAAHNDLLVVASGLGLLRSFRLVVAASADVEPSIVRLSLQVSAMCILPRSDERISRHVVLAAWDDPYLQLWDVQTGSVTRTGVKTAAGLVRSMVAHALEDALYLFIGYGDGLLEIYRVTIPTDSASSPPTFLPASTSAIVIGNEPVKLSLISSAPPPPSELATRPLLFAISNRPFLINSVRGKIHLSLTNFKVPYRVTEDHLPSSSNPFPSCPLDFLEYASHMYHLLAYCHGQG